MPCRSWAAGQAYPCQSTGPSVHDLIGHLTSELTASRLRSPCVGQIKAGGVNDRFQAQAIDVDLRLARDSLPHAMRNDRVGNASDHWDVDLRFDVPAAPHNAIEPRCAVAGLHPGGGPDIWAGTQDAFYMWPGPRVWVQHR